MGTKISKPTRRELLEALRERYRIVSKPDKSKILDEFIDITKCHRKHAIRLLTGYGPVMPKATRPGRTIYSEAVRQALVVLWEASDRICGKRLKAILPGLISAMERHGHLSLDLKVRQLLLEASPATIDRLLSPIHGTAGRRRKRKATSKSSREIPVRTFADWKEPAPGFLEIDFVAHGGDSMEGTFLWNLVATDVCSGWTDAVALVAREQSLVVEGLEVIRRQLPVPILGIDSDNDSAFINETLQNYCKERKIEFTRSWPYKKNDQAWIEQKNGSVIRRFVGYRRFSGLIAGQCLARIHRMTRLYVNFFRPSFKLLSKTRDGAKIKKALLQSVWVNFAVPRHRNACFRPVRRCRARVKRRESPGNDVVVFLESQEQQQQLLFSRSCETARQIIEPCGVSVSSSEQGAPGFLGQKSTHTLCRRAIKKMYHKPATPCERLLAHTSVSDAAKEALRAELAPLDPAELLYQIREGQAALAALSSGDLSHGPDRQSLEEFLAKLPELWREGDVRPTHRNKPSSPRAWRTRKDPFEEVWPEILVWLQHDPDSTAKSLMERLQQKYPGRFPDVQLRTLQRRIRDWRHVMAKSLVHGIRNGDGAYEEPTVVGASADSTMKAVARTAKSGTSEPKASAT